MKSDYTGIASKTLWKECRGEPEDGILAVASVIWNRHILRHLSIDEVCLQYKQFSCWNDINKCAAIGFIPKPTTKKEFIILQELQRIEEQLYSDLFVPTGVWTHYHHVNCNPAWSKDMTDVVYIGHHKFGVVK